MTILIIAVHVVVCFVLILVILLQAGRGSGLSWGSFSGTPQSFFGTKSASVLKKATSVSAIVFLITCIFLNVLETKKAKSLFSTNAGKQTQVDVNKIKEVLEKLKAEQAKTGVKEPENLQTTNKDQPSTTTSGTPAPAAGQPDTQPTPPPVQKQ